MTISASTYTTSFAAARVRKLKVHTRVADFPRQATVETLLHFKYIPQTGVSESPDVQYPTVTPGKTARIEEMACAKPEDVELSFEDLPWRSLPTLRHIVERLARLEIRKITKVKFEVQQGGDDVGSQRRLDL